MAILRHIAGDRWFGISERTFVGRREDCALRTDDLLSSELHALIAFEELPDGAGRMGWIVRDLGSRNGTYAGGQRLASGVPSRLAPNLLLSFGTEQDTWEVVDLKPPGPSAVREREGALRIAEDGMLSLPCADGECTVIHDGIRWRLHVREEARPVQDQEVVQVDDVSWRLLLPPLGGASVGTRKASAPMAAVRLEFRTTPSQDEILDATVVLDGTTRVPVRPSLGVRLLLALAAARLDDAAAGEPPDEQGWRTVEEVCNAAGFAEHMLATNTFRARKVLADAGVPDAYLRIEDRGERPNRELRLWYCDVFIHHATLSDLFRR